MNKVIKDGIEVKSAEENEQTLIQTQRCAEFIARMIEKYGKEIEESRLQTKENTTY